MSAGASLGGISRESLASARERLDGMLGEGPGADRTTGAPDLSRLGDDLFAVVRLLDTEHALRRALSDPARPAQDRRDVVRSLLGDRVGAPALDLVEHLAGQRWGRASDLSDAGEILAIMAEVTRAEREGHLHDLEDELFRFGRIVDGRPQLRVALSDPALPPDRKRGLVERLLEGKVRPATQRLLVEVVTHPRGRGFDRALQVHIRIAAQRRERLIALVRTARPLSDEHRQRLADVLSNAYGHEVHINVEVDPDVIGGLSVRLGDEVIDGTVAGRLSAVRRRLGAGR